MIIQDRASIVRPSYPQLVADAVRLARRRGAPVLVSAVMAAPAFEPLAVFHAGGPARHDRAL